MSQSMLLELQFLIDRFAKVSEQETATGQAFAATTADDLDVPVLGQDGVGVKVEVAVWALDGLQND